MNINTELITRSAGRLLLKGKKVSPTVLVGVGVVGVVATAVLASRATLKLEETLDEIQDLKTYVEGERDEMPKAEYAKEVTFFYLKSVGRIAKLYSPALSVGAITISSMLGSYKILQNRNVALAAAYTVLESAYSEYREHVVEEVGPEKEYEIRKKLYEDKLKAVAENSSPEETTQLNARGLSLPSNYARFFDELNPHWSRSTDENLFFLKSVQNYMNDRLRSRGHVFLNEVYEALGFPDTPAGAVVGWLYENSEGDGYIDFDIFNGDDAEKRAFVNMYEKSVLLDFNVDGLIYNLI